MEDPFSPTEILDVFYSVVSTGEVFNLDMLKERFLVHGMDLENLYIDSDTSEMDLNIKLSNSRMMTYPMIEVARRHFSKWKSVTKETNMTTMQFIPMDKQ